MKKGIHGGEMFYLTLQDAGVEIVNDCDLMEILFPGYWSQALYANYSWEEMSCAVVKWCMENDAHYYAREKHEFIIYEAVHEAKDAGKSVVVVENMS